MKLQSIIDIDNLIINGIQENNTLEYKAALAMEDKEEISKDISAMANSAGGIIIYGVAEYPKKHEKKHHPEKRDPIKTRSHEYLDQVINSNIEPKVRASILSIPDPTGGNIIVVTVEPGETAHQASDKRYYRRYNFENLPMRDHEIRDVMNRSQHPKVNASFSFVAGQMVVQLVNEGQVLAKNMRCFYKIPKHFLVDLPGAPLELIRHETRSHFEYYLFDEVLDKVLHSGLAMEIVSHPLTEVMNEGIRRKLSWPYDILPRGNPEPYIYWKVYADNSKPVVGECTFYDCLANSSRIDR